MTPLRWLVLGTFVNRAGSSVHFLLVLYLVDARGFSAAGAGAVATAWGLGALVAQPIAGALADGIGRRAVLVGAMSGGAVSLAALGLARSPPIVAACSLAAVLCNEGFRPAVQAMIADLARPEERVRAYGWNYWATNAGFMLALGAGGLLASVTWSLIFALAAVSCAAFAAVAAFKLPETRPVAPPQESPGGYVVVLRDLRLLRLTALQGCFGFLLLQSAATLPLAMAADGLGSAAYGLVMAFAGGVVVLLQPPLVGPLGRRDRGLVFAAGLLLVGAGMASTGLAGSFPAFAATVVVWTIGEIVIASVAGAMVAAIAPATLRGRYLGVFSMALPVAGVVAPVVGTAILQRAGEATLWTLCAVLGAVACAAALADTSRGIRRWA